MKKYIMIIPFALITILIISSFIIFSTNKPIEVTLKYNSIEKTDEVSSVRKMSIEDIIKISTAGIVGEFISCEADGEVTNYDFKIKEVIYGNAPDEYARIKIKSYGDIGTEGNIKPDTYKDGHEYLLLLRRKETLFLDYARYSFMGYFVIDLDNLNNAYWENGSISITENATKEDVINHFQVLSKNCGYDKESEIEIFRTEDIETIIKNCDAVFKVKVITHISDGIYANSSSYGCEVIEKLKGDCIPKYDGTIMINTLKGSLTEGKEYIIALSQKENGHLFDQASPDCIFSENENMECKIKEWLN